MKVTLEEHRMVDWAQELGFDGGDARDAAIYIRCKIGTPLWFEGRGKEGPGYWYIFSEYSRLSPERFAWVVLKYGEYFI